jgi:hypothetical protein
METENVQVGCWSITSFLLSGRACLHAIRHSAIHHQCLGKLLTLARVQHCGSPCKDTSHLYSMPLLLRHCGRDVTNAKQPITVWAHQLRWSATQKLTPLSACTHPPINRRSTRRRWLKPASRPVHGSLLRSRAFVSAQAVSVFKHTGLPVWDSQNDKSVIYRGCL